MKFILGFLVGGLSYAFMAAPPPPAQREKVCVLESGDSIWNRKKEIIPCPARAKE